MSVLITCTSETRPDNPGNGDLLYETDTNKLILYYDGWITYGQSNTSTGGETPTVVFSYGDSTLFETLSSDSQTGDMFLDLDTGVDQLNILTNTTSSVFVFDNLSSDPVLSRFISTQKSRPNTQSIQQYITGGDQDVSQLLSASDFTTTQSTPDLFYIYDNNMNNNRVYVFGRENTTDFINITPETDIDLKVVDDTTTQQLSTQPVDHAFTIVNETIHDRETIGVYNSQNHGVFGAHTNKLAHNTSFNLTCSSDGTTNYTGRYITTGNQFLENSADAYSFDMWFYLLPSIETHTHRQLFGYSTHHIRCVINQAGSYMDTSGSYFGNLQTAPGSIQLNNWHRVTNTRSSTGDGKIYLDSQLVHTYTYTGNMYIREMAGDSSYTYNDNYMHGYVYSIGTWKRELTIDEINDMSDPTNTHKHVPYFWLFPSIERTTQSSEYYKCRDVITPTSANTALAMYKSDPDNSFVYVSYPENIEQHELYTDAAPFQQS